MYECFFSFKHRYLYIQSNLHSPLLITVLFFQRVFVMSSVLLVLLVIGRTLTYDNEADASKAVQLIKDTVLSKSFSDSSPWKKLEDELLEWTLVVCFPHGYKSQRHDDQIYVYKNLQIQNCKVLSFDSKMNFTGSEVKNCPTIFTRCMIKSPASSIISDDLTLSSSIGSRRNELGGSMKRSSGDSLSTDKRKRRKDSVYSLFILLCRFNHLLQVQSQQNLFPILMVFSSHNHSINYVLFLQDALH